MLKYLFWILWSAEIIFLLWMLWDEMKLKYLPMPAYIPLGFIWLFIAILVKLVVQSDKAALVMVGIPGVPLMIMGVFLLIIFIVNLVSGPIRWN
ncbi:MAG TPA: hypothetical protein PKD85_02445 [Saprospiraceae bacterium]|nr:hypothetical protein [Saprospiraceae bacterium]